MGRQQEHLEAQQRIVDLIEKHLESHPDDARALCFGAKALFSLGETAQAREWCERALKEDPHEPAVLYNVACANILMGDNDRAITLLEEAVKQGFGYRAWLEQDGDLDPIRDDERFKALMARLDTHS